jgi:hypothetical protein
MKVKIFVLGLMIVTCLARVSFSGCGATCAKDDIGYSGFKKAPLIIYEDIVKAVEEGEKLELECGKSVRITSNTQVYRPDGGRGTLKDIRRGQRVVIRIVSMNGDEFTKRVIILPSKDPLRPKALKAVSAKEAIIKLPSSLCE